MLTKNRKIANSKLLILIRHHTKKTSSINDLRTTSPTPSSHGIQYPEHRPQNNAPPRRLLKPSFLFFTTNVFRSHAQIETSLGVLSSALIHGADLDSRTRATGAGLVPPSATFRKLRSGQLALPVGPVKSAGMAERMHLDAYIHAVAWQLVGRNGRRGQASLGSMVTRPEIFVS